MVLLSSVGGASLASPVGQWLSRFVSPYNPLEDASGRQSNCMRRRNNFLSSVRCADGKDAEKISLLAKAASSFMEGSSGEAATSQASATGSSSTLSNGASSSAAPTGPSPPATSESFQADLKPVKTHEGGVSREASGSGGSTSGEGTKKTSSSPFGFSAFNSFFNRSSGDDASVKAKSESSSVLRGNDEAKTSDLKATKSVLGGETNGKSDGNGSQVNGSQESAASKEGGPKRPAPVHYEQFGMECQNIIFQDNFDGFRLEAGKLVNKNLQASHVFLLGCNSPTGCFYQFGPTLTFDDGMGYCVGRVNLDGTVNGRLSKKLPHGFEGRVSVYSSLTDEMRSLYDFSLDKYGKDWVSSAKLVWQGSWILNGCVSKVITDRLQLGGELTWIATSGASIAAVAGRYNVGGSTFSCILTRMPDFKVIPGALGEAHALKLMYSRKVSDRLSIATESEFSHPDLKSSFKVGWDYLFRQARVQGMIDSSGKVSLASQDSSGFGVSGVADYWKGDYKFGFTMQLVPPPEAGPGGNPQQPQAAIF